MHSCRTKFCCNLFEVIPYIYWTNMKRPVFLKQIELPARSGLIPFTDWAHNAHSALFEQSLNAHYFPSLSRVYISELSPTWYVQRDYGSEVLDFSIDRHQISKVTITRPCLYLNITKPVTLFHPMYVPYVIPHHQMRHKSQIQKLWF